MEGAIEVDLDTKIAEMANRARGKKTAKVGAKNKRSKRQEEGQTAVLDRKSAPADNGPPDISISIFDDSVENYFRAIERICKLSGEAEGDDLEKSEVERLSSSITFLREWMQFNYQPRAVQFACQSESSPQGKDVISGITLPQFSAATVPGKDEEKNLMSMESRKDFVMNVGGAVWALDWCPRVHQRSGHQCKCEFVAVAAHPAESSYHKIGAPLTGRGIIQVWCILTTGMKEDEVPQVSKKPTQSPSVTRTKVRSLQSKRQRGRPRKNPICESGDNPNGNDQYLHPHAHPFPENLSNFLPKLRSPPSKKQRGRPRKKAENESLDNLNGNDHHPQALAVRPPEHSCNLLPLDIVSTNVHKDHAENDSGSKRKDSCQGVSADNSLLASSSVRSLEDNEDDLPSLTVKVKSPQSKRRRGRPRKNHENESVDDLNGNNQYMQPLAENSSNLLLDIKSPPTTKKKGRPRKKAAKESLDNNNGSNHHLQDLSVLLLENSCNLPSLDMVSTGAHKDHAENDSGRKRKDSCQGVSADNSLLASSSVRSLEDNEDDLPSLTVKVKSPQSKRRRGRPRKNPENESIDDLNGNNQYIQPLAENSSNLLLEVKSPPTKKKKGRPRKKAAKESLDNINGSNHHLQDLSVQLLENSCNLPSFDMVSTGAHKDHAENDLSSLAQNEHQESFPSNAMILSNSGLDPVESSENVPKASLSGSDATNCVIPMDVALPRVVLCLAHNGKVAWDIKWRPNVHGNEAKHRMGYLAVLLGNGALEVWDVPLPQTMNVIFSGSQEEGADPRFVKLEPIFRCSNLKCGDRQSIPLTVEWSTSSPHDLILAGCHDGVVALWKFSASGISEDTRPLLCFSADTVPIRAVAWAPFESDPESANVIVTAGHRGLKFWDIRDPFRPLWDLNTVQRTVYSLDWLPDPRCIIVSVDDGTLRVLSLAKAAYDVPVSGKPFVGTQQQGFHSYYCSPFAIWSVHVSRPTGMVAYCCEDGTVLCFQLTYKAVEKDPLRNRAPHFLCGSLSEEDSALTVISPLPDIPYPMKKSLSEWGNAPRTIRGFLAVSNQEKRAKEQTGKAQTSDDQPLALCYGNDPGTEFGSEDPGTSQMTKRRPKAQASSKKSQKAEQALVCIDEEPEKVEKDEMDETEVFPPKTVAMHRVRWNMNKGSQRWLCYGGAGGIVRCQEVDKPAVR